MNFFRKYAQVGALSLAVVGCNDAPSVNQEDPEALQVCEYTQSVVDRLQDAVDFELLEQNDLVQPEGMEFREVDLFEFMDREANGELSPTYFVENDSERGHCQLDSSPELLRLLCLTSHPAIDSEDQDFHTRYIRDMYLYTDEDGNFDYINYWHQTFSQLNPTESTDWNLHFELTTDGTIAAEGDTYTEDRQLDALYREDCTEPVQSNSFVATIQGLGYELYDSFFAQ